MATVPSSALTPRLTRASARPTPCSNASQSAQPGRVPGHLPPAEQPAAVELSMQQKAGERATGSDCLGWRPPARVTGVSASFPLLSRPTVIPLCPRRATEESQVLCTLASSRGRAGSETSFRNGMTSNGAGGSASHVVCLSARAKVNEKNSSSSLLSSPHKHSYPRAYRNFAAPSCGTSEGPLSSVEAPGQHRGVDRGAAHSLQRAAAAE